MPDLWKYSRAQSDTDAETFFAACVTAGTTLSAGQKTAIYNLVGSLKWASLWSKMTALYPFIGGTAATHAINLKSPGTYNITWSGTVTHDANGITGNGSTGYGNTSLTPSSASVLNSESLAVYSRTNSSTSQYDIGCYNSTPSVSDLQLRWTDGKCYTSIQTNGGVGFTVTDSLGLFVSTRTASNKTTLFKSGRKIGTTTQSSTTAPDRPVFILARNGVGFPVSFSSRNLAFSSIGSGLSDSDATNLSAFVQSYQTALGRAV